MIVPVVPRAQWLGCHRIELDECDSTNDDAARLARAGARHGTVVIARAQRAGRGRDGRRWASPRDAGLYLSAVIRTPLPLVDVPPMTLAIGVGLCDAARAFGAPATLKWPNDALVHGKKLAGVLVEAHSQGHRVDAVIVGIGINLGSAGWPPEVAAIATSMEQAAGAPIDRAAFIERLLAQVERWIDRYVASGLAAVVPAWHDRMAPGLTARARVDGSELCGELAGLDGDGALLLRDAGGGLHRVRSGDVEVIRAVPPVALGMDPAP
ncbi:MAG TPA: biotin--[acetyl-CoA-carboxylase] ligase [Kofleriaceae bacterium]|jgi:BirA family biotin operon repressor/biotin-[acetyl-CoA-carboxylase] ligase|nr:biotin--[acetyl-CoA-carboxylase] ligase [Kofleriaceae bacterium]